MKDTSNSLNQSKSKHQEQEMNMDNKSFKHEMTMVYLQLKDEVTADKIREANMRAKLETNIYDVKCKYEGINAKDKIVSLPQFASFSTHFKDCDTVHIRYETPKKSSAHLLNMSKIKASCKVKKLNKGSDYKIKLTSINKDTGSFKTNLTLTPCKVKLASDINNPKITDPHFNVDKTEIDSLVDIKKQEKLEVNREIKAIKPHIAKDIVYPKDLDKELPLSKYKVKLSPDINKGKIADADFNVVKPQKGIIVDIKKQEKLEQTLKAGTVKKIKIYIAPDIKKQKNLEHTLEAGTVKRVKVYIAPEIKKQEKLETSHDIEKPNLHVVSNLKNIKTYENAKPVVTKYSADLYSFKAKSIEPLDPKKIQELKENTGKNKLIDLKPIFFNYDGNKWSSDNLESANIKAFGKPANFNVKDLKLEDYELSKSNIKVELEEKNNFEIEPKSVEVKAFDDSVIKSFIEDDFKGKLVRYEAKMRENMKKIPESKPNVAVTNVPDLWKIWTDINKS